MVVPRKGLRDPGAIGHLELEMLSEHQCQGWLEGYLLTGRHGFFSCYEGSADPGQLGIEIFGPNAENDPDRVSIPLFERVRNGL
jgi:hypothetical protein